MSEKETDESVAAGTRQKGKENGELETHPVRDILEPPGRPSIVESEILSRESIRL